MTGSDYINFAKNSFYPVETYVSEAVLATFLNTARRKVFRYGKIGFQELSFNTTAQTYSYTLSKKLLDLFRVILQWDNTIRYELRPIAFGHFPLSVSTFFAPPWNYSFVPMDKVYLYPCPDRQYSVFVYGVPDIQKLYTGTTLSEEDTDITTENYLEPVSLLVASQIARFDQNYELSTYFEDLFFRVMGISKV